MISQSQNSIDYWGAEEQRTLLAKKHHERFLSECRKTSVGKIFKKPLASIEPIFNKYTYKALYEYTANNSLREFLKQDQPYECLAFVLKPTEDKALFLEAGFNVLSHCSSIIKPIHIELIGTNDSVFWQIKYSPEVSGLIRNAIQSHLPNATTVENDFGKSICSTIPTDIYTFYPQPPYYRNLIVPKSKSNLPLLSLLSAISQLEDDEWFLYRVTIEPAHNVWGNNCQNLYTYEKQIFSLYKDFSFDEGTWFINPAFESKQSISTKLSPDSLPLFFVSPTIIYKTSSKLTTPLKSFLNSFRFGDQFYNELSKDDYSSKQINKILSHNHNYTEGHLLNREETAHFLLQPCQTCFERFGQLFSFPTKDDKNDKGILIGRNGKTENLVPFNALEFSIGVLGNQGMGKSNLMLSILSQIAQADYGMILFNFKDTDWVYSFIASLPKERLKDIIIASPIINDMVLARNVVDGNGTKATRQSADLAYAIENATSGLGVNIKMNLKQALLMTIDYSSKTSLEDVLSVLDCDDPLGRKIRSAYKKRTRSKQVLKFIHKLDNKGVDISTIQNKLQNLLDHEDTAQLYMYNGPNKLDYKDIIENNKILIWNLTGTGSAGDSLASLEVSLIHKHFQQYGKTSPTPKFKTLLAIDEVQRIQAQGVLDSMRLDREFGLSHLLATQSLLGVDQALKEAFNLISNLITFQCSEYDAKFIASKTSGLVKSSDIMALNKYEIFTRIMSSLNISKLQTIKFQKGDYSCIETVIKNSLDTYYTHISEDIEDYKSEDMPQSKPLAKNNTIMNYFEE